MKCKNGSPLNCIVIYTSFKVYTFESITDTYFKVNKVVIYKRLLVQKLVFRILSGRNLFYIPFHKKRRRPLTTVGHTKYRERNLKNDCTGLTSPLQTASVSWPLTSLGSLAVKGLAASQIPMFNCEMECNLLARSRDRCNRTWTRCF